MWLAEKDELKQFSEAHRNAATDALETWRAFLLGKINHPRRFEQHLLPFDSIDELTGAFPPNFNRYLLRGIEIDAPCNQTEALVHSKLGRFIILGFIEVRHPQHWTGSKVHVRNGIIAPRKYRLPAEFGEYLKDRAVRHAVVREKISDTQLVKIDEALRKDPSRAVQSETFRAMTEDVRLFGDAAFAKPRSPDKRF